MTEERKYPRTKNAPLMRVRDLSSDINDPVRIMGVVLKSTPGSALVQDIYDEIDKAKSIWLTAEGTLNEDEKYILIGTVTERVTESGKEIRLDVSIAHNVDKLDIKAYKEALQLEERVVQFLAK